MEIWKLSSVPSLVDMYPIYYWSLFTDPLAVLWEPRWWIKLSGNNRSPLRWFLLTFPREIKQSRPTNVLCGKNRAEKQQSRLASYTPRFAITRYRNLIKRKLLFHIRQGCWRLHGDVYIKTNFIYRIKSSNKHAFSVKSPSLRASSYEPGYRDGLVNEMNFVVGSASYGEFQPGYRDEKWWRDHSGVKFND